MSDGKLIAMANQIAAFFAPYPEEAAVAGIRDHLVAFWTPKMRADVAAQGRTAAPGVVDPRVVRALGALVAPVSSPLDKEMAGPQSANSLASDAG